MSALLLKDRNGVAKIDGNHVGYANLPTALAPLADIVSVDVNGELYKQSASGGGAYGYFYKDSAQLVPANINFQLPFTASPFAVGMTPTSPTVVVNQSGVYRFNITLEVVPSAITNTTWDASINVRINGTNVAPQGRNVFMPVVGVTTTNVQMLMSAEWIESVSAGDTVDATIFFQSAAVNGTVDEFSLTIQQIA